MLTSFLVLAEGGLTWTPETFYIAAAVVQVVIVLLVFRAMGLPAEYNTFINAIFVVVPSTATAFFTKDMGIVGVLLAGVVLFVLLAAVARGDVLKAIVAWLIVIGSYWALAYFIVPAERDLYIEDLAGVPQVLMEGGMEAEPMTADDYEKLRDGNE